MIIQLGCGSISPPYLVVSTKRHREFDEISSMVVKKDDECTIRVQKGI